MSSVSLITATLILIAGVIDDLRSKKVHNWLFLLCALLALAGATVTGGFAGFNLALIGFFAGLVILMPLVLLKVIGAGDMKLFAAFGAAVGWNTTFDVAVWALIWGAIFGVVQVTLRGQLKATLQNMIAIAQLRDRQTLTLHKIPFTIALLMGWLTDLVRRGVLT
jgi:prepilin peptidase CpaA